MTEQEIERCLERFTVGKATDVMNFDYAGTFAYIQRLKAENAAMRKQISEMIMPPCTLGDKLYHYELSFGDGFDENGNVIHTSSMDIIETEVTRDNIWRMCDLVQNKRAFFSREALAASFKERFQKGREQFVKEIKDDKRRTD